MSEETRKKQSESISEYYRTHPASFQGRHHTEETKRKMSENKRGEKNYNYGMKLSEEIRKRMSESAKIGWEKRRKRQEQGYL